MTHQVCLGAVKRVAVVLGDSGVDQSAIFLLDGLHNRVDEGVDLLAVGFYDVVEAEGEGGDAKGQEPLPPAAFFRQDAAEGEYAEQD